MTIRVFGLAFRYAAALSAMPSEILRGAEEFLFRAPAGNVVIDLWLEGLLLVFHAHHEVGVELMKPSDNLELIEVVVVTVMGLADENRLAARWAI